MCDEMKSVLLKTGLSILENKEVSIECFLFECKRLVPDRLELSSAGKR